MKVREELERVEGREGRARNFPTDRRSCVSKVRAAVAVAAAAASPSLTISGAAESDSSAAGRCCHSRDSWAPPTLARTNRPADRLCSLNIAQKGVYLCESNNADLLDTQELMGHREVGL